MLSYKQKYKLALRKVERNKSINTIADEGIPKHNYNCLKISKYFLPKEEINSPIFKKKSVTFEREVKVCLVIKSKKSEDLWWDDEEIDNFREEYIKHIKETNKYNSI